jgi:hypothetical protein
MNIYRCSVSRRKYNITSTYINLEPTAKALNRMINNYNISQVNESFDRSNQMIMVSF